MLKNLFGLRALALAAAALLTAQLGACGSPNSSSLAAGNTPATCEGVFDAALEELRESRRADVNLHFEYLSTGCSKEYNVIVDYVTAEPLIKPAAKKMPSCKSLKEYLDMPAIRLIREDGDCKSSLKDEKAESSKKAESKKEAKPEKTKTSSASKEALAAAKIPAPEPESEPTSKWPGGDAIAWDDARNYVGSVQRVCGPLMSFRNTDWGIFYNVGRDYPSLDRFTFVMWDWWNYDSIPGNATVCGAGSIYLHEGVTQMEISNPDNIEIWY